MLRRWLLLIGVPVLTAAGVTVLFVVSEIAASEGAGIPPMFVDCRFQAATASRT